MHTLQSQAWVEIACDESGFSGSNLLDPESPVITHAGVDLTLPEAAEVVAVLRSSRRRRSTEYKSNLLLRPEHRSELEWFLTALRGRAHVHVIDKTWYVARRVIELLVAEPSYGAGTSLEGDHHESAIAIYQAAGRTEFLDAFITMTRTKRLRLIDHALIDRFFETMPAGVPALQELTRTRVEDVLLRLIDDDPAIPPPLEPMVPALAETALFWSAGRRSVAVVHDEQSALTRHRIDRLRTYLAGAAFPSPPPLLTVTQVDSRRDPRVQVADLLAGIARRLHAQPSRLLQPYLVGGIRPPTTLDQTGWRV
ncbi:hypothetical protein EV652_110275 [Kribbella steppae]|uniref:DUF3800 domain-containing protein n=1 Tax=Kribbella steppae TaxID=2512223 RepID=A0A4R2H7Q7_9ACTN|nr:DUF3800 domain-containing protein [Kribbella steppae]TCO22289.1 hypothetical protein EV652_110275 [Kribbella steppae]